MVNLPVTYCSKMDWTCPAFYYGQCRCFEPCQYECGLSMELLGKLSTEILKRQAVIMKRLNQIKKQAKK